MRTTSLISTAVSALLLATAAVAAADKAAQPAFDTKYIPKETAAALVLRPARVLNSRIIKEIKAAGEKAVGKKLINTPFRGIKEQFGTTIASFREIVVLFDAALVKAMAREVLGSPQPDDKKKNANVFDREIEPREPGVIIRFHKPVDQKRFFKEYLAGKKKVHLGKTYYVNYGTAMCFVDPKTVLIGPESTVKKMIAATKKPAPLAKLIAKSKPTDDGVIAITGRAVIEIAKIVPRGNLPASIVQLLDASVKIKSILATGRLSGKTLAIVRIETADLAAATQLAGTAKNLLLPMFRGIYKKTLRPAMLKTAKRELLPLVEIFDELLSDVRIDSPGATVSIQFARPRKLDALPKRLGPAFERMKVAAQLTETRNNLKQIARAMRNYAETYNRFPRHGSDHAGKKSGLSWRVHILPYILQSKPYKQFKLDEPWDSKHNRKLIAKMPDRYKHPDIKAVGKTSFHVFLGEGTPFGGKKPGTRIRDVTDGTSYTILAVALGPGKAE
ncbi:MAG: DUF1559 domain-containing protein, partial [Planctomycetes bacterium]|nr:DUF1559 domain-containing protein [Planctomycetota bacterium]